MMKLTMNEYLRYRHYLMIIFSDTQEELTRKDLLNNYVSMSTLVKDFARLEYEHYGAINRMSLASRIMYALQQNEELNAIIYTVLSRNDESYAYSTTVQGLAMAELRLRGEGHYIVESKDNYM